MIDRSKIAEEWQGALINQTDFLSMLYKGLFNRHCKQISYVYWSG
jgi:hypothetical protein